MTDFAVIVSGGGPAGLAAACLYAQRGLKTALISKRLDSSDPRTTALMRPAINLLQHLGLWTGLKPKCAPLRQLHIIDDTEALVTAPPLSFHAQELGLSEFGFNVPLDLLVPALWERLTDAGVTQIDDLSVSARALPYHIEVTTASHGTLSGQALVIADGANSALRDSLGFTVTTKTYDQMALATSFSHTAPHDFVSTEWHKAGGPFTTVPMPGERSSLVWMAAPEKVTAIMALSDEALAREIQLESHGRLGRIFNVGPRKAFAMNTKQASPLAKSRAFLLGEAGHAMPPIGAQGLNLSLRDVAQLADIMKQYQDAGSDEACAEYDKLRGADVAPRLTITALLNTALLGNAPPANLGRVAGLASLAHFPPLRDIALKAGLNPPGALPTAMRPILQPAEKLA